MAKQEEMSNRASSQGQNGDSTSKNCPIERGSRTKRRLNMQELSNRAGLADKIDGQTGGTVQ